MNNLLPRFTLKQKCKYQQETLFYAQIDSSCIKVIREKLKRCFQVHPYFNVKQHLLANTEVCEFLLNQVVACNL